MKKLFKPNNFNIKEFEESAGRIIKSKLEDIENNKRERFEIRQSQKKKEREERAIINRSKTLWSYKVKLGDYWFAHGIVWSNDINEAYSIVMGMYPGAMDHVIKPIDCSKISFEICEHYI